MGIVNAILTVLGVESITWTKKGETRKGETKFPLPQGCPFFKHFRIAFSSASFCARFTIATHVRGRSIGFKYTLECFLVTLLFQKEAAEQRHD